jgi:hypothetical protein
MNFDKLIKISLKYSVGLIILIPYTFIMIPTMVCGFIIDIISDSNVSIDMIEDVINTWRL